MPYGPRQGGLCEVNYHCIRPIFRKLLCNPIKSEKGGEISAVTRERIGTEVSAKALRGSVGAHALPRAARQAASRARLSHVADHYQN